MKKTSAIGHWDVFNVTTMRNMFTNAVVFNDDLSGWEVFNVTNILQIFSGAFLFSADLSDWNVSFVTSMGGMFSYAGSFLFRLETRVVRVYACAGMASRIVRVRK